MRVPSRATDRHVSASAALTAIVVLAGCGGATSTGSLPAATQAGSARQSVALRTPGNASGVQRTPIRGWMSAEAKKARALLYVSLNTYAGTVNIYNQSGKKQAPIGQLSGFQYPNGIFVDPAGDLYVTDSEAFDVPVFKHGATTPYETLNDANYYPYGVAEDSKGNVFVANAVAVGQAPGNINVYKKGSLDPTSTLDDPNYFGASGIATDSSDNVYACFNKSYGQGPFQVVEFRAGTTTPIELGLSLTSCTIGLLLDGHKEIIAADPFASVVDVFAKNSQMPTYSFGTTGEPVALALNAAGSDIYVTDSKNNAVDDYAYPSGTLLDTITNGITSQPFGVAAYPALKL